MKQENDENESRENLNKKHKHQSVSIRKSTLV